MTNIIVRSLATNFGGVLETGQFHTEIENDPGITPTLIGINSNGDVINIEFSTALSAGEETILDTLISNHVIDMTIIKSKMFSVIPEITRVESIYYTRVATFQYAGSNIKCQISYIEVISSGHNIDSYDIQVQDYTNGCVVLASNNFTNTDIVINDMGVISNTPLDPAILEISVKKNESTVIKGSCVHIHGIMIHYKH